MDTHPNKDEQSAERACAIFALGMVDRNVNGFWTALHSYEQQGFIQHPTRAMTEESQRLMQSPSMS